ncbi:MAG: hypothetical protein ACT4PM_08290 [Gemmatimonadales bacterium]
MTAAPKAGGLAAPLQVLLAGAIDYAGLFPPAGLEMSTAVTHYLIHRDSPDWWALGRFVVPATRLAEFSEAVGRLSPPDPLRLSVVIGPEIAAELALLDRFETGARGWAHIEAVEVRAPNAAKAPEVLAALPDQWLRYIEVPVGGEAEGILDLVAGAGPFAKVRTGGTIPEAFPHSPALARFLAACAERRLPFKATAGLHHPLRGSFPLTYQWEAKRATMYGYLNVALAAAMLWAGNRDLPAVEAALTETVPSALQLGTDALGWRSERFDPAFLAGFRRDFFHGFGSCSFHEPLDELAVLMAPQ